MYSKPGEGLSSAHSRKVERSFKTRQPLNSDHLSPKARKALAEAKQRKAEAELRAQQEAVRRNNAAMMARMTGAPVRSKCTGWSDCPATSGHQAMCQSQMDAL